MTTPATHDLEARALWHLELDPAQMYADAAPGITDGFEGVIYTEGDDFDDDDDDEWNCTRCGGEAWTEVDDPMWDECDEFGYGPCPACRGTGERRHQWVF